MLSFVLLCNHPFAVWSGFWRVWSRSGFQRVWSRPGFRRGANTHKDSAATIPLRTAGCYSLLYLLDLLATCRPRTSTRACGLPCYCCYSRDHTWPAKHHACNEWHMRGSGRGLPGCLPVLLLPLPAVHGATDHVVVLLMHTMSGTCVARAGGHLAACLRCTWSSPCRRDADACSSNQEHNNDDIDLRMAM